MKNVKKHRLIKLATTEKRKNYLVSDSTYHNTKFFTGTLVSLKMRKTQILMNKPVFLGLLTLKLISNILMYKFQFDDGSEDKKARRHKKVCHKKT